MSSEEPIAIATGAVADAEPRASAADSIDGPVVAVGGAAVEMTEMKTSPVAVGPRASMLAGRGGKKRKPVYVQWKDLEYQVPVSKKEYKTIVNGVSGFACPGEVLAIMGPSGCGKSTLLGILSGTIPATSKLTGTVTANGEKLGLSFTRKTAGVVNQDDLLFSNLTVRETLEFSAYLRLPKTMTKEEKDERVDATIADLGLRKVENSLIGGELVRGISGGERKRVSIASEMIRDVSVLLLDEPTTGLDSFVAYNVVNLLKDLAKEMNMTIITTIHQPRSQIWSMFDKLLLLSEGKTMYFGSASGAIPYFAKIGYPCPPKFNPADFVLDLVSMDYRTPEREKDTKELIAKLASEYLKEQESSDEDFKLDEQQMLEINKMSSHRDSVLESGAVAELEATASFTTQYYMLVQRAFRQTLRNKIGLFIKGFQAVFFMIVIGFIYYPLGTSQQSVQDRLGLLFFVLTNQTFGNLFPVIDLFFKERAIYRRENKLGFYSTLPYFIGKNLSELPFTVFFTLLFGTGLYWIAGLQADAGKFFIFLLALNLIVLAAESIGYFIGAFSPSQEAGSVMALLFGIILMIFGGLYVNPDNLFVLFKGIGYLSTIKYGYSMLMGNEFDGLVFTCADSEKIVLQSGESVCPIQNGDQALSLFSLSLDDRARDYGALIALTVGFRVLSYVFLRLTKERLKLV